MQQAATFSGVFAGIALLVMLCARGFDRRISVAAAVLVGLGVLFLRDQGALALQLGAGAAVALLLISYAK